MKTGKHKKDRVNIVTLGCSKNLVDSEVLLTQLQGNEIEAFHQNEAAKANIVIVNTCGFIERAKAESIQTILDYAEKKSAGEIDKLFVTGCLSERYRADLSDGLPEVDGVFGTMDMPDLLRRFNADYKEELVGERRITTDSHYAYLKISEGCNRPCGFCAIPLMRGKHKSRSIESLVEEATFLVKRGVKELMLIAQELTFYGVDLYQRRRLDDLLRALSDVEGLRWIRLHYAYPSGFPTEILPIIRERSNICNYLDMPLQHISDAMLTAMRRGITKQKTIDLVKQIRDEVPDITLRTTMLVGYPNETEQDFEELLEFVEQTKFDRLGVFNYSHEDQTYAFKFDDNVPEEVKEERQADLMAVQQDISLSLNQAKVGKTFLTLIDRKEGGNWIGRTEADSPEVDNEVILSVADQPHLKIGEFYPVSIYDAAEFDLFGRITD